MPAALGLNASTMDRTPKPPDNESYCHTGPLSPTVIPCTLDVKFVCVPLIVIDPPLEVAPLAKLRECEPSIVTV